MMKLRQNPYFRVLRVRQYAKNVFIYAPLLFDGQLLKWIPFVRTTMGFLLLCVLCSGIYCFNDLMDIESDRNHPRKRLRPIASGEISRQNAEILAIVLICTALICAWFLSKNFFFVCLIILTLNIAYSLKLKHIPLIDVITIGILFLLRVASGITLVSVKLFSPWLYVVTFMLALYLGFGKRRAEIAMLPEAMNQTRPALDGYSIPFLDQMITIVSSVTIMSYTLYTFSGPTLPSGNKMMLTVPFVIYGVFRYHWLIQLKHEGGAPEEVLFSDRALQITIVLYALTAVFAIYF